jgi:hypothetical protein
VEEEPVRSALVIATGLIAAASSATRPSPRPLEIGLTSRAGAVDPYEDGTRHLVAGQYQLPAKRFGQALASDRRPLDALDRLAIAYTRLGRWLLGRMQQRLSSRWDGDRAQIRQPRHVTAASVLAISQGTLA